MSEPNGRGFWARFSKFWETFWLFVSNVAGATAEAVTWYVRFLVKLFLWSALVAAVLFLFPLFTWFRSPASFGPAFSVWLIAVGVLAFVFLLCASPLLVAARVVLKTLPTVHGSAVWMVRIMAATWFWILLLAIYFYVVPVGDNPAAIPLVLLCAAALVLGAFTGWVNFNEERVKRFLTGKLVVLFFVATFSFAFPQVVRTARGLVVGLVSGAVRPLTLVADPKTKEFQSLEEVKTYPFFAGGIVQLYYDGDLGGEFQLFDSLGNPSFRAKSPFTGRELRPVKSEKERQEVITWYERHFQKLEAERKAREFEEERSRELARQEDETKKTQARETKEREERDRLASVELEARQQEEAKARAEAQIQEAKRELAEKIAKGIVPPLTVFAKKPPALSNWLLFFTNTSSSVACKVIKVQKTVNGVTETTPFIRAVQAGTQEFMVYHKGFRPKDVVDVFCEGFSEPYRMIVE